MVLMKEERLKRYRDRVKIGHSKISKKFYLEEVGIARKHTNNLIRKRKDFGARYNNEENIIENPNELPTWEKS